MDFKTFAKVVHARAKRIHINGLNQWSLSDWFVEAGGEMGEAMNIAKKLNRLRDNLIGNDKTTKDELMEKLADELGDAVISIQLVALSQGVNLEVAVARKFNKTSEKLGVKERLWASNHTPLFFEPEFLPRYIVKKIPEEESYGIYDVYQREFVLRKLPEEAAKEVAHVFSSRERV
jgi:NTP pyrophosphatase (non-canonical NTP hydrolase)